MENFISVGYHKGEIDFSVSSTIQSLSQNEMDELRRMLVVAIGTAEQVWRESRPNEAQQNIT